MGHDTLRPDGAGFFAGSAHDESDVNIVDQFARYVAVAASSVGYDVLTRAGLLGSLSLELPSSSAARASYQVFRVCKMLNQSSARSGHLV